MLVSIYILISYIYCLFHVCLCVDIIYYVEEEKHSGSFIGDIATDSHMFDEMTSENTDLSFSELKRKISMKSQLFNVTKNGKLYTAQVLDAESLCTDYTECFRIIKVAIRKAKTFMKILKVKVIIEDINDNRPEFPDKEISLQFSEGDAVGMTKSIPNAIDKDVSLLNSQITYKLRNEIRNENIFSLFVSRRADGISTLGIVLEKRLDREAKDNYRIQIVATDKGSKPKQSILNVRISVKDENDNRPIFSPNIYNITIKHTHKLKTPVIILSAVDLDINNNARVTYHFSPKTSDIAKNYFLLNSRTGEVVLIQSPKLNDKLPYKLYIEAKDGGSPPLTSIATVLVNVINQHNNPPSIDIDYVSAINDNTATISEDIKVGSFIAYVMVTDNDVGQNGEVSCDIKDNKFKLQSMGPKEFKVVMKSQVDREIRDNFNVTIICHDKGFPSLKAEKTFSIHVTDINDVRPQFTKETFQFLTYENEEGNFPIGFVNATDPDLGPGGLLTYTLIPNNNNFNLPFHITDYGFISTSETLDREQQNIYKFQVLVKDNGKIALNNTANVVVEVLDENDNAPYFTFPSVDPFNLDVHYHPQSKSDITVLRASDRDSGNNAFLKYEILSGNNKLLFTVNHYTGLLAFSRPVYQNDVGTYNLVFAIKDSGSPVLSATTTISLTLTVSNSTSTMFVSVPLQSDNMINLTWVIIIVVAAVVVSVAVVIAITLCIIRFNNNRNVLMRQGEAQPYQSRTEMRQLIYQTNSNPILMARNTQQLLNRNSLSLESTNQFYPEIKSLTDWKNSALLYNRPITVTSYGEPTEQNAMTVASYLSDTLSTRGGGGGGGGGGGECELTWKESQYESTRGGGGGGVGGGENELAWKESQYEEIPALENIEYSLSPKLDRKQCPDVNTKFL
ncbi:protocadherin beta-15 [Octopus bimaculoides]|nr:protocadherin beta-15 [Octopus bimaculoides]|eukprot:XP_014775142.1 PREDICTED: protocadherin beta-15-like [Octopus bimaculoides]